MKHAIGLALVFTLMTAGAVEAAGPFISRNVVLPHAVDLQFGQAGIGPGEFDNPTDAAYHPVIDFVYVVDQNNNRVQFLDMNGVPVGELGFGGPGSGLGELTQPTGVAVNPGLNVVYVTDTGNHRVQIFDAFGAPLDEFGSVGGVPSNVPGEFDTPRGIAYDPINAVVYVVDSGNNRIQVFDEFGTYITDFGFFGPGPGEFDSPHGIAVDEVGDIYVADENNHRVQKLDLFGNPLMEWGGFGSAAGLFNGPGMIAANQAGLIYVADQGNNRIEIFDLFGAYIDEFGSFGTDAGRFQLPGGMAFTDFPTTLYVVNRGNNRVDRFQRVSLGQYNSLATDASGRLHLSTYAWDLSYLVYGVRENNVWAFEVVDGEGTTAGEYSSLVLDSLGNPHISYHEAGVGLKYATKSSGFWTIETVHSGAGNFGVLTSIDLDSADRPMIAHSDDVAEVLWFEDKSSGAWVPSNLGGAGIQSLSLKVDSQDLPHIGYLDYRQISDDEVRYQHRVGGAWITEIVASAPAGIGDVSLALDNYDLPRMSYQNNFNELEYAERLTAGWHTETVASSASQNGISSSLFLDPDGSPRIAYGRYDSGPVQYLEFAFRDAEVWHTQTVANTQVSTNIHASIAPDPDGNPLIAYLDVSNLLTFAEAPLLNVRYMTPNTVRVNGFTIGSFSVFGSSVGFGGSIQLEESNGPGVIPELLSGYISNNEIHVEFDLTGAATGSYDLIFDNFAGPDTLFNAVVLHDEDVDLARIATDVGSDEDPAFTRPGVDPVRMALTSLRSHYPLRSAAPLPPSAFNIYVMEPFGGGGTVLPDVKSGVLVAPSGGKLELGFSPDGSQLVYRDFFADDLFTLTLALGPDQTPVAEITGGPGSSGPEWSPVSNLIAYSRQTATGGRGIFTVEQGTDIITQLTNPPDGSIIHGGPTWSPDGERIAFTVRDTTLGPVNRIVTMSATEGDAGGLKTVLDNGAFNTALAWSPDGRWIAFHNTASGNYDIWVVSSNGEQYGLFQITNDPSEDVTPAWTPDGTGIAFRSYRGGNHDIYLATNLPMAQDADGDLVPDLVDGCPADAPGPGEIDRDFDGCADETSSYRQTRFWSDDQFPVYFTTDADGDSSITDGSDFTALASSFAAWHTGPLAGVVSIDGGDDGTRAGPSDAMSNDLVNSVTFADADGFTYGTVALTLSTVAESTQVRAGRWYRPDEVLDSDILFNTRDYNFETPTSPGPPGAFGLAGVGTHEFGHFFGLRHSAISDKTMFYVVSTSPVQETLELGDQSLAERGYGNLVFPAVQGTVTRGAPPNDPVVGAAIYAIDEAFGDTLQMTLTGTDGTYRLYGPLSAAIRIYVLPVDGGPSVHGLTPSGIGPDYAAVAETDFVPEFWDLVETNNDFGSPGDVLNATSFPFGNADIITNPDLTPPNVVSTFPVFGDTAAATTAITVKFDERISLGSISSSTFSLEETISTTGVAGTASLLKFDSLLVFTPTSPLMFDTDYTIMIGAGIEDKFGNPTTDTTVVDFRVESQPPLTVTGVSPSDVPVGGTLVVQGTGFDNVTPAQNEVLFNGANAFAFAAGLEQLFLTVPSGAQSGGIRVVVGGSPDTSNTFPINIVPPKPIPVGTALQPAASLSGDPREIVVRPDGAFAYVATDLGVSAVNADPGDPDFMTEIVDIPLGGGSRGVAAMPDGKRVFAISSNPPQLNVIDADATSLFENEIVPGSTVPLPEEPLGISVVPGGAHVLIAYQTRVAKHVATEGPSFGLEVQEWKDSGTRFRGEVGVAVDAAEAFATTLEGRIAVLSFVPTEGDTGIVDLLPAGTAPREVAGRPDGLRFLAVDEAGTIREYDKRGPLLSSHNESGGYRGLSVSPEGTYAYAANFILNKVDVFELTSSLSAPVTTIPTGVDPTDITTGFGGRYLYVASDDPNQVQVFDTEDAPVIQTVNPKSGGDGSLVTLIGNSFAPGATVDFGGMPAVVDSVSPDSTMMVVTQPAGASSSGISVMSGSQMSNTRPYKPVNRPDAGNIALAAFVPTGTTEAINTVLLSPTEEYLFTTYEDGSMIVLGGDPSGPDFLRPVQTLTPAQTGLPAILSGERHRMVMTPDGRKLYFTSSGGVFAFSVAPAGTPSPVGGLLSVAFPSGSPAVSMDDIVMGRDGKRVLALSQAASTVLTIDTAADTITSTSYGVSTNSLGAMAVHPRGGVLYVGDTAAGPTPQVHAIDINPDSPTFQTVLGTLVITTQVGGTGPYEFVPSPDGTQLIALTAVVAGTSQGYYITHIGIDPASPGDMSMGETVAVALDETPTLILNHSGSVIFVVDSNGQEMDAWSATVPGAPGGSTGFVLQLANAVSGAISADDARVYAPGFFDNLLVMDVASAATMSIVSGTGQIGIANQPLAAPIVAQVQAVQPELAEGTVIGYTASPASGDFGYGDQVLFTAADENGFASANYIAGPFAGEDTVQVNTVVGSIATLFTVVADTGAAPPQIVGVSPISTATPGVGTRIAVDFSKTFNPTTVSSSTFILRQTGDPTPIPGFYTMAQSGRRSVLTPSAPLQYSTNYEFELVGGPTGILDYSNNQLTNPGVFTFTTAPLPALVLSSVEGASALHGNPVVLAGQSFSPVLGENTVLFEGTPATPTSGNTSALTVSVPFGASSGDLQVVVNSGTPDTSNAISFQVLSSSYSPMSQVVESVTVPSSGQQIAALPNGLYAYMTSAGANTLVPIDIIAEQSEPAIPVGLHPWGVATGPNSKRTYVSNFFSNTVSCIDSDTSSVDFHQVIYTIPTGHQPTGVAVHPDGRTLYVACFEDSTVEFIDIDSTSATFNTGRASINTGSSSQAVTVSPDGLSVIVGTSFGLLVLDAEDGAGRASINTGTGTKAVTVSGDGILAAILTDDGQLLLVDIRPGIDDGDRGRASINTGTDSKGVTISGDGGFVFVTAGDNSVLVYEIVTLGGGAAVAEPQSGSLSLVLVDEIMVGENPEGLVILDSGLLLVVNSGDKTVSFINASEVSAEPLGVTVQLDPNTLNLSSKGKFMSAAIEFPAFLDPLDVDLTTVRLNSTVAADSTQSQLTDKDEDGIDEIEVKFLRSEVFEIVPEGQNVVMTVTGVHDGRDFFASDSVRVFRPHLTAPSAGAVLTPAVETLIEWESIQDGPADHMDIYLSTDLGESWEAVVEGTADDTEYAWQVPDVLSNQCLLVLVAVDDKNKILGIELMSSPFGIGMEVIGVGDDLPTRFALLPAAPNPSLASTNLRFELPEQAKVTLRVFAIDGSLVRELANDTPYPAGRHEMMWDGRNDRGQRTGAGVYFMRLKTSGNQEAVQKIVRLSR